MKMKLKLGNKTQVLPTPEHHVFLLVESHGEILLVRMMGIGIVSVASVVMYFERT